MTNTPEIKQKRTAAFWVLIIIGTLLIIEFLLGQTMAIINYNFTVSIGLQEPEGVITGMGVALNKGFGFGDTVFYIPLFIIGIVGLLKRKAIGHYAMTGALAITVYWPLVCLSTLYFARGTAGFEFDDFASYTVILSLISVYGIWGGWYVIANRKTLAG